jgi:isoleucyl-tRNA synthetase
LLYPSIKVEFCNPEIERAVARMQSIVEMARKIRETKNISLKVPLKKLSILVPSQEYQNDLESLVMYLQEEVRLMCVQL